jgi:hypothetical protein
MRIGAGRIDGVDAVNPAVKDRRTLIDIMRIGAVGRVELGGDGKFAAAQDALQAAARGMSRQGFQRRAWDRRGWCRSGSLGGSGLTGVCLGGSVALGGGVGGDAQPGRGFAQRLIDRLLNGEDLVRPCICWAPDQACTQTQGMSGSTSQLPLARTPPQGPLRNCFGQFIGQDMPVEDSTHWPHIRQSNRKPLTCFSTNLTGASAR